MNHFLWGALAMASFVAGLFFLRFWRSTRDRLFLFLCAAFWVFALNWSMLGLWEPLHETRHYGYAIRWVGFMLILIGIIDKNRRNR
jgi:Family of unknown function (DUF5985)